MKLTAIAFPLTVTHTATCKLAVALRTVLSHSLIIHRFHGIPKIHCRNTIVRIYRNTTY